MMINECLTLNLFKEEMIALLEIMAIAETVGLNPEQKECVDEIKKGIKAFL